MQLHFRLRLGFFLVLLTFFISPFAKAEVLPVGVCESLFMERAWTEAAERTALETRLVVPIGEGRKVTAIYIPAAPSRPTLLLMPGKDRAMPATRDGLQALVRRGFGIVSVSYSLHIQSVAALDEGDVPYFRRTQPKLTDLADDIMAMAQHVRDTYHVDPIPVTLSHSGSVSPFLKGFPLVIETAPMTAEAAAAPASPEGRAKARASQIFNPFFGESVARRLIDQAYDRHWTGEVDDRIAENNYPPERRADYIQGLSSILRASEDADWSKTPPSNETRHVFLVGDQENAPLLKHQLESFKKLHASRPDTLLFVVKGAKHYIPGSQPEAYAAIVDLVTSEKSVASSGGVIFFDLAEAGAKPNMHILRGDDGLQAVDALIAGL